VSGHPSAAGRAQDRESTSAKDRRSTTEPTPPTDRQIAAESRQIFIFCSQTLKLLHKSSPKKHDVQVQELV